MFSKAWNRVALGASAAALSFGMAASAQALEIGCTPVAKLPELRAQMNKEGQAPIIQFYSDTSAPNATTPKFTEFVISANAETKEGHRMYRADDGGMCVVTNMKEIQLYDHSKQEPDFTAYLQTPGANNQKSGINRILFGLAKEDSELPMLRAKETFRIAQTTHYTYIVANKSTGYGGIVSASLNGQYLDLYSKEIPSPQFAMSKYGASIKNGAQFTASGLAMLSQQMASNSALGSTLVAKSPTLEIK